MSSRRRLTPLWVAVGCGAFLVVTFALVSNRSAKPEDSLSGTESFKPNSEKSPVRGAEFISKNGIPLTKKSVIPPAGTTSKSEEKTHQHDHLASGSYGRHRGQKKRSVELGPMLFYFGRELALTKTQRHHFREVLRKRSEEVEKIQEGIRRTNVLVRSDYRKRIQEIKLLSYDRMGECLDSAQYDRFEGIVDAGRFGDAIAFDVPNSVQILD